MRLTRWPTSCGWEQRSANARVGRGERGEAKPQQAQSVSLILLTRCAFRMQARATPATAEGNQSRCGACRRRQARAACQGGGHCDPTDWCAGDGALHPAVGASRTLCRADDTAPTADANFSCNTGSHRSRQCNCRALTGAIGDHRCRRRHTKARAAVPRAKPGGGKSQRSGSVCSSVCGGQLPSRRRQRGVQQSIASPRAASSVLPPYLHAV